MSKHCIKIDTRTPEQVQNDLVKEAAVKYKDYSLHSLVHQLKIDFAEDDFSQEHRMFIAGRVHQQIQQNCALDRLVALQEGE